MHPAAARQSVGGTLCDALEKLGAARGIATLTVEASDTAQPFFAGRGYIAQRRTMMALEDEWLGCTTMTKTLAKSPQ